MAPGLYLVATPIGNLRDITLRALDCLAGVDLIACEDTRVTAKLLSRYGITRPTLPYHDHNAAKVRPQLVERLRGGARIALVSDAGTPLVSDPGLKLVQAVVEAGLPVTALPGPSAVLAALSLAGLPTDRFLFSGFLPPREGGRRTALAELAASPASLVFFETGPRLADTLADMADVLGGARPAAIARELTKLYEEVRRGTLADLAASYAAEDPPRGEIVIVTGPPVEAAATEADIDAALARALATMPVRDAADLVARSTGARRKLVYARALVLKGGDAR